MSTTPPATPPVYLALGAAAKADSVLDPNISYFFVRCKKDGARFGERAGTKFAYVLSTADRLDRVAYAADLSSWETFNPHRGYVSHTGLASAEPVNQVPYIQDYRLILATFAYQVISTPEPKLKQILSAGTQQIHPDHPHNDASAHSYGALMDWARGVIGLVWTDTEAWEVLPKDPALLAWQQQKTQTDNRLEKLCAECASASWAINLQLNINAAVHRGLLQLGTYHGMDRTSKPWGAGGFIASKPGGRTVQQAHDENVVAFEKAVHYYFDKDIGNVPPRGEGDRPIYIPAHFFPPSPVQY